MNKLIFEDKKGSKELLEVSNYCNVSFKIQDGKIVHIEYKESKKMKKIE